MRTLVGGMAVVAVLLLGGCSSAQPVGAGTATPTAESGPTASPTPTVSAVPSEPPAPARPVALLGLGCEELVPVADLEDLVGGELVLADPAGGPSLNWGATRAAFDYAGGLYCTWNGADGEYRAMASMTPNARAAAERISAEFDADPSKIHELHSGCGADGCIAAGFVGDDFVTIAALAAESEAAEAEMARVRDAVAAVLDAAPPAAPLPPLSARWGDGPESCAEMLPAAELAAAAELDGELTYGPGYAYESSNGSDHALLTAGGFACRYWPGDGGGNGTIRVLPDAAAALYPGQALAPDAEIIHIDGAPDGPAVVECSSNGDPAWSAGSTGVCTVHTPARGGWATVSASGTGVDQAAVVERASRVAAAIVAALG